MSKSNLAFITALYNTKGADFYVDIYFPIIKYAAMDLFYESNEISNTKYYGITGLQNKIQQKTGITIPLLVLKNSIRSFSNDPPTEVSLELYKNGEYFKISKAWEASINIDIDTLADSVAGKFRELELLFQQFLEIEQLDCNKSFADLFSTYSDEALSFINQQEEPENVGVDYVNLITFIKYIQNSRPDYYTLVNDYAWASVVTGFLQRSKTEIGTKTVEFVDYYLDTAIVLSLLGLNTSENVSYARDLVRIINESGGRTLIHPLTVQEVNLIFTQLELAQGPKPGSAIQMAWERDRLKLSDIIHYKNSLLNILDKEYSVTSLTMSRDEIDSIIQKYKKNYLVKELAEKWKSTNEEYFREIHDVYMHDFVSKKNEDNLMGLLEKKKAYFVTLNSDLLTVFKDKGLGSSTIHPGKVVMSLWIHNSRSVDIKKSVLTEIMSRCYALNQTDVRRKIKTFGKHYKGENLTEEDMQNMYSSLIRRSASTLEKFDEFETIDFSSGNEEKTTQIIKSIIENVKKESKEQKEFRTQQLQTNNEFKDRIYELENRLEQAEKINDNERKALNSEIKEKNERITVLETEIENRKIIDKINEQLVDCKTRKSKLDAQRNKSICMFKYWILLIGEAFCIALFLICCTVSIIRQIKEGSFDLLNWDFGLATAGLIIGIVLPSCKSHVFSPKIFKQEVRKEQLDYWDNKHPEYQELLEQINNLEKQKIEIGGYLI